MLIKNKTEQVRSYVATGQYMKALAICKSWRYSLPSYTQVLQDGYESKLYPDFYRQLGKNPEEYYNRAVELLKLIYLDEEEYDYEP